MRFNEGPQRITANDRRDHEPGLHRGRRSMNRALVTSGEAASLGRRLTGDRRKFDRRCDARRLRTIVYECQRAGLVVQGALPKPL